MNSHETIGVIFTVVTAFGVLLQAFVLLGMFLAIRKTTSHVHELSDLIKQHLIPTIATTRNLVEDISPKVKVITSNLVDASSTLRSQAENINKTVAGVADMAQAQASRVDEMATAVLDGLTQATAAVQHGISTPLKQVTGVLNGVRAGLDVFRKKSAYSSSEDGNRSL